MRSPWRRLAHTERGGARTGRDQDAGARMTRLLSVEKLSKSFGGLQAVAELSFGVDEGQILGIIGPNGAGKTTAVNLVSGVIKPTSGRVTLGGKDVTGHPPHILVESGLVRTFQNTTVYGAQTVRENLLRGAFRDIYPGLLATLLDTPLRARRVYAPTARDGGDAVARPRARRRPGREQPALRLPEGVGHGDRPRRAGRA